MEGSNGQNGNGNPNGKSGIVAKPDPLLSEIVPRARRETIFDTRIPEGARMLYCLLTDCSLWRGVNVRPGVVRFANSYLARRLNVDEKTIQNWKRALKETGRIWTTEKRMKNCYPTTVYNITAIVGQADLPFNSESDDGSLPEDEVLNNRSRPRTMERDDHGKWVKREGGSKSEKSSKSDNSTESLPFEGPERNNLPSSAATICRPQRQSIAVVNGNHLPPATETNCREERQSIAEESG